MGNSVILILADGGDDKECNYGQYLRLQKSGCIAYNNDFEQINDNSISYALKCECPDSTSVYVIREQAAGGQGFKFNIGTKQERAEKVGELIDKQATQDQIIVIAHQDIDEQVLQEKGIKEIMCYRTDGDEGTECEWKVVCDIVEACLSQNQSLSFEQIKEKIEYCPIKKKIRIIIHKLELLIAPLKIECEDKEGRSVNIDNEINQQIRCLLAGENCGGETKEFLNKCCGGKSLKQLLEEGKYLSNDEISDVVKQLNVIPTGSQDVSDVRNICNNFYKNLQGISKKVFFK